MDHIFNYHRTLRGERGSEREGEREEAERRDHEGSVHQQQLYLLGQVVWKSDI